MKVSRFPKKEGNLYTKFYEEVKSKKTSKSKIIRLFLPVIPAEIGFEKKHAKEEGCKRE